MYLRFCYMYMQSKGLKGKLSTQQLFVYDSKISLPQLFWNDYDHMLPTRETMMRQVFVGRSIVTRVKTLRDSQTICRVLFNGI